MTFTIKRQQAYEEIGTILKIKLFSLKSQAWSGHPQAPMWPRDCQTIHGPPVQFNFKRRSSNFRQRTFAYILPLPVDFPQFKKSRSRLCVSVHISVLQWLCQIYSIISAFYSPTLRLPFDSLFLHHYWWSRSSLDIESPGWLRPVTTA